MLTRFDPFRDFDRLVEQLSPARGWMPRSMPLDIARGPEGYVVQADLPGVNPETIDLSVEGNVLTIQAQRTSSALDDMEILSRERAIGTHVRRLTIGDGFDLDNIRADYTNGVLTVSLPVPAKARPRKIEVALGSGDEAEKQKAVEVTTSDSS